MDQNLFHRIQPTKYHEQFLQHNIRSDGRGRFQRRPIRISKDHFVQCDGSASIRCGTAYIFASVKAEILAASTEETQYDDGDHTDNIDGQYRNATDSDIGTSQSYEHKMGKIIVTVDFPRICRTKIDDAVSESMFVHRTHVVQSLLSNILNSPTVCDLSQLYHKELSFCWVLYVSILCVQYDGCPLDMCLAAAVSALEDTKIPVVIWDSDENWWRKIDGCTDYDMTATNTTLSNNVSRYFVFLHRPEAISFANISRKYWIVDPCQDEERVSHTLTFIKIDQIEGKNDITMCSAIDSNTSPVTNWMVYYTGGIPSFAAADLGWLKNAAEAILHHSSSLKSTYPSETAE